MFAVVVPSDANAASTVVKAAYTQPACRLAKDKCPTIDLKRIRSDDPWVTTTMDRIMYPPCWSDMESRTRTGCTLQEDVNEFANESAESVRQGAPPYSYVVTPQPLKDWGRLKQFSVRSDLYTGGAHGLPSLQYVVLDPRARKQLQLTDVMTPAGIAKLRTILREKNRQRILADMSAADAADYMETFKFELSENFVFGRTGLEFLYNVYEIASYAEGQIEFTVPYTELKGFMRPDFYPPASYLKSLKR